MRGPRCIFWPDLPPLLLKVSPDGERARRRRTRSTARDRQQRQAGVGLGRMVASHYCSPALHQIH
jgi:hypothetical protein